MKHLSLLIPSLLATATLALADGIPVDPETGKVTSTHTVVSLSPEQIEETQTLGTFTLTPEQWRKVRADYPQCPKRFTRILPVTWNDCLCCVDDVSEYVIALSRDRIAVLHDGDSGISAESLRYYLIGSSSAPLRMNERGEFHLNGQLIPFPTLLKALATAPADAKRNKERQLYVVLPMGSKQTDAVFESRLRKIAAAADRIRISHYLFPEKDNE